MKMKAHPEINVLYIELSEGEHASTIEIDINTYLDLDANNNVLGVEILNGKEFLDKLMAQGGTLDIPSFIADPSQYKPDIFVS